MPPVRRFFVSLLVYSILMEKVLQSNLKSFGKKESSQKGFSKEGS